MRRIRPETRPKRPEMLCGSILQNFYLGQFIWSVTESHPIRFVGHSAGAQVVRVLQKMLLRGLRILMRIGIEHHVIIWSVQWDYQNLLGWNAA
ncbi:hypothetical protein ACLB2K_036823 [Fragaria x ananassa]